MPSSIDNPESADAVARGCTCDLIKNDFGRGQPDPNGRAFFCSETCSVHGVLKTMASPATDGGLFTYEYPIALRWLKSRVSHGQVGTSSVTLTT